MVAVGRRFSTINRLARATVWRGRRAGGFEWLLNAGFDGPDLGPPLPASLGAPYVTVGGPLTLVDTGGVCSIVDEHFIMAGGDATSPTLSYGPFDRVHGRTLWLSMNVSTTGSDRWRNGWSAAAAYPNVLPYLTVQGGQIRFGRGSTSITFDSIAANTDYPLAHVLLAQGSLLFQYIDLAWRLAFVTDVDNTDPLYVASGQRAASDTTGRIDHWRVADMGDAFDNITLFDVNPAIGDQVYTAAADSLIDLEVTAPAALDGLDTTRCGFYYRADSEAGKWPSWHAYFDGTGAFRLDRIDAGGARTNHINAAGAIAGGASRTIRIICYGSYHKNMTSAGLIAADQPWTENAAPNTAHNNAMVDAIPEVPAGWTLGRFRAYPHSSARYDVLF